MSYWRIDQPFRGCTLKLSWASLLTSPMPLFSIYHVSKVTTTQFSYEPSHSPSAGPKCWKLSTAWSKKKISFGFVKTLLRIQGALGVPVIPLLRRLFSNGTYKKKGNPDKERRFGSCKRRWRQFNFSRKVIENVQRAESRVFFSSTPILLLNKAMEIPFSAYLWYRVRALPSIGSTLFESDPTV